MRIPPPLPVDADDVSTLRGWVEDGTASASAVRRARIVLLASERRGPSAIAAELGCSRQTVITWRERYRSYGLAGLRDSARSGRPATVDADAVIAAMLEPPAGVARWTTRLLAAQLGISNVAVANVWRACGVAPGGPGGVRLGTDPVMDSPVTAVAGLVLDPSLRLLAVFVGAPSAADVRPPAERPDPGRRLTELDPGASPRVEGHPALERFLERLGGLGAGRSEETPHVGLIAEGETDRLRYWAGARPGVTLHTVPSELSWASLARVACLLAGTSEHGAESVRALCDDLPDHRSAVPFSWVHER